MPLLLLKSWRSGADPRQSETALRLTSPIDPSHGYAGEVAAKTGAV
jgi:hypothetical protein